MEVVVVILFVFALVEILHCVVANKSGLRGLTPTRYLRVFVVVVQGVVVVVGVVVHAAVGWDVKPVRVKTTKKKTDAIEEESFLGLERFVRGKFGICVAMVHYFRNHS